MKACGNCGDEIMTLDGDNTCTECKKKAKARKRKKDRQEREDLLKSLGLTKVKGARGGTYWE